MNHAETIKQLSSEHFGIPLDLLSAKTRKREVVIARQSAMVAMKEFTNLSLKNIGAYFGGRDHATVIHALVAIQDLEDTDSSFSRSFAHFKELIMEKIAIPVKFDPNQVDKEFEHLI
jgi:chromosomal replication initiator protein